MGASKKSPFFFTITLLCFEGKNKEKTRTVYDVCWNGGRKPLLSHALSSIQRINMKSILILGEQTQLRYIQQNQIQSHYEIRYSVNILVNLL